MNASKRVDFIKNWITDYVQSMPKKASTLVVGVSGGIDSAVVSTISSMTGLKTFVLSMPIKQIKTQDDLSKLHCKWLVSNFKNVSYLNIDLDNVFSGFENALGKNNSEHAFANSRARLRMVTLYQVAGSNNGIVVGTGNKVEDFGVGFYTKYGDGGVDISPIADCTKSQVWEMGEFLEIDHKIINAPPTDGLWVDGRNDEDQLGMTYKELEEAMENGTGVGLETLEHFNKKNQHKMQPIPTFKL